MLLGDALCLEHIVFQFLLGASGVQHQKRYHEHSLVLALQFFQKRLRIFAIGSKVRRDNIHVIAGTHSLFLFLDFGTVKLGDGSLDGLNRRSLVNRLDVQGHDLRGFHIQKIRQHTVGQI